MCYPWLFSKKKNTEQTQEQSIIQDETVETPTVNDAKKQKAPKEKKTKTPKVKEKETSEVLPSTNEEIAPSVEENAKATSEKKSKTKKKRKYDSAIEKILVLDNTRMKIVSKENRGTFGLYAINLKGKQVPLLSTAEDYSRSFFALLWNDKVYRLNQTSGIKYNIEKVGDSIQITYDIKGKVTVIVELAFAPVANIKEDSNIVKVTASIMNNSKIGGYFTLKAVLDTVLGENYPNHFSTKVNNEVKGFTIFEDMTNDKWIRSNNINSCMQVLLCGQGITSPEKVYLSNLTEISGKEWEPEFFEHAGFNNILSYNNSAIAIHWPKAYLNAGDMQKMVFYIATSGDAQDAGADSYIAYLSGVNPTPPPPAVAQEPEPYLPPETPETAEFDQDLDNYDFVLPPLQEYQLTQEYIQALLDKIAALESDPDKVDRVYIRQLNTELDAILSRIRGE